MLLFVLAYFLIKDFLLKNINPQNHDMVLLLGTYNTIWAEVIIAFVIISIGAFLLVKRFSDKLLEDTHHFTEYLEEINKKNYDAVVHIQHYTEFLRMSLIFKNLVKRLKPKDKKV
ncbi:hypothetical protein [Sulfurimonas sp.]